MILLKTGAFTKKERGAVHFLGTCFFSTERGDETQELPSNFWGLITITIIYPVSNGFFSKSYYRYNMTFNYKFDVRVAFDNPIGDIFADTVGPSNHFFTNSETFTKINNFFSQAAKENND